ncbi:MAG: hypothetical protein J5726_07260 [Treponema sp.]|nr:hypothetical protein [Treponema sp.]
MEYAIAPVLLIILAVASLCGIIVSAKKLHDIKKGAAGNRAPWILLLVVCSLYIGLFIAGIIFIFILMASIVINGM